MDKRFYIHCYDMQFGFEFPNHPANTYVTGSKEKLLECIKNIVENTNSGFKKIVIEDGYYEQDSDISCCAPMEL